MGTYRLIARENGQITPNVPAPTVLVSLSSAGVQAEDAPPISRAIAIAGAHRAHDFVMKADNLVSGPAHAPITSMKQPAARMAPAPISPPRR